MEKFNELLQELQKEKILQTGDWSEDIPNDIYEKYFRNNHKEVAYQLDIDTHRWYELATTVIEIYDRFLGIRVINNVFSENMGYEDCCHNLTFFEMEPITIISYKKKL